MSDASSANRRRILGLLASVPAWIVGIGTSSPAQEPPSDRGIGGTGARPPEDETPGSDRGIGGTGVIGTIRRFGSIVVNDLRIAYPRDVAVRIDGAPAHVADLRIGHVVRVVAHGPEGALSTRAIVVTSEVVGPVEAVGKGRLTVLGQSVTTASLRGGRAFTVGERVAVSGLRRADGSIVASLIEARGDGLARVAGPVRKGADGVPTIGDLKLDGMKAGLVGRRAVVEGRAEAGSLAVAAAQDASRPFPAGVAQASIEGYVASEGGALRLGSGLRIAGAAGAASGTGHAIVTAGIARDGQLRAEAVRPEGRATPLRGAGEPGRAPQGGRGHGSQQGPRHAPSGGSRGNPPTGPQGGPGRGLDRGGDRGPMRGDGPRRDFGPRSGQGSGRDLGIDTRPVPGGPSDGFGGGGGGPGGGPGGGFGGQGGPGGGPGFGGGGGPGGSPGGGFGGGGPGGFGGGGPGGGFGGGGRR